MEQDIKARVSLAKIDNHELEALLRDYLPFIKGCVAKLVSTAIDREDAMTVAMLAFANSVKLYEPNRGEFLAFCAFHIRHRLVDEWRKQNRHQKKVVSLFPDEDGEFNKDPFLEQLSVSEYNQELQRQDMADEIDAFSRRLAEFGIIFSELERISPKQKRARELCNSIARELVDNQAMRDRLLGENKIPITELAKRFQISIKTVEKHRRYIVVLSLLLMGDYPHIKAFLPEHRR